MGQQLIYHNWEGEAVLLWMLACSGMAYSPSLYIIETSPHFGLIVCQREQSFGRGCFVNGVKLGWPTWPVLNGGNEWTRNATARIKQCFVGLV